MKANMTIEVPFVGNVLFRNVIGRGWYIKNVFMDEITDLRGWSDGGEWPG